MAAPPTRRGPRWPLKDAGALLLGEAGQQGQDAAIERTSIYRLIWTITSVKSKNSIARNTKLTRAIMYTTFNT